MTEYDKPGKSLLVVGIGASAGGLDALQRFLAVLPKDFDFALVFIQHLSAKHKSLLPELLSARRPSLVIQEISDGLKIQAGRLYLAPPGREVRLRDSFFQTTVHTEGLIHLSIDEFLSSLAEDAGERSIAVILSGAGTDGARGCQAVRSAGGTVFVQDPETAEFNSMPLAAIASGMADAVLSPEQIAGELLKLQRLGEAEANREGVISAEEYDSFFRLLQEKTGGRFNHYKKSVVTRRIRRRMYLQGLPAVKDYLGIISTNDSEAALLAADLMIGVTSFFRDRVAWKALNLEAVRKIASGNTGFPIRVWTPASSTGEEAYSIAMMFLHELALAGEKRDVHVFATDVNERALERAREGKYPASIAADVPQEYVQKYFMPTEDGNFLVINKEVRETVVFARQDLLTDPPFSKLDLIICRNFMIYLEPDAQEKCITLFHYALNAGGFLFLGNAETVGKKNRLFQSIGHKQCRVFRKLETKPASRLPISVPYAAERSAQQASKQAQLAEQRRSFTEIVQEKLLEEYAPASVAIDQNYEIIYHNGPTNKYLLQPRGVPTQNLLELLPENLRSRIRGALYRSSREGKTVSIRASLPIAGENPPRSPLSKGGSKIIPPLAKGGRGDLQPVRQISLRITKSAENLFIIVFQEKGVVSTEEAAEQVYATVIEETAIHQLEGELSATRQDLQSHIEQLKSLNEELQSSNEELQAANEELETSREELQSLNEELITVNSQLQGKIEEQETTNDDLNNFLASANIPTIFLDTHFRVKRFTPAMLKLIKLLPSDVGRPIADMSQENLGPDLTSDAQVVLERLVPARQELELGGAWYVRTTLPYRTAANRIEGVVVTYNDVTELKKSEERTRHLASFPELNPNPICEVHSSGKINFCNPATVKVLANLGMDTKDVAAFLPEDMDDILRDLGGGEEKSIYRERVVRDSVFGMTVHLMPQFNVVRIYAYDITERKRAEESVLRAKEEWERTFDSVPDLIAILDNNHRIKRVNAAMARKLGLTPEECIGKHCYESVHGLSCPPAFCPHARTIKDGRQHIEEVHEDRFGGDFIISTTPLYDDKGQMIGSVHVAHDITERKKAEKALGRLAAIVESADDAIIGKDQDGIIQTWNVGAENIFGYKAEEVIGRNISLLIPPGYINEEPEILARIKQGEHIENFESVRMRKDGSIIPVSLTFSAIKDASGKIIGASKIAHDITGRKKSEYEIQTLAQQRQIALDAAHLGWWQYNPITRISEWDDGYKAIFGVSGYTRPNDEILAQSIHPDDLPALWAKVEAALNPVDPQPYAAEYRINRPDGALRWIEAHGIATFEGEGADRRAVSLVGTVGDITERKQAEQTLRESKERFRSVLDNSLDVIYRLNVQTGRYEYMSPSVEKVTGFSANELMTLELDTVLTMIHPDDLPAVRAAHERLLETGEGDVEYRQRTKGGDYRWLFNHMALSKDSAGRPLYRSGNLSDITERKRAEEALRESEARLSLAQQVAHIGTFEWNVQAGVNTWTPELEAMYGLQPGEFGRTQPAFENLVHPEDRAEVMRLNARAIETGEPTEGEWRVIWPDDSIHWVAGRWRVFKDSEGKPLRMTGVNIDITERKRAEEALLRLNKTLKALSDSSQAVIRAKDEPEYLNDVCRIIVYDCGYSMVWIGFAENDDTKSVRPAAYAGFEEGYLETLKLTWADTERGRGPTGAAIRMGNVAVCRNMLTDPAFAPWREEAIKRGYASSIVFPLRANDRVFGAITMYSKEADPFTEDEIRLLTELTDNVAYGIEILRIRVAQKQAEEALRKSEEQFRTLSNSIPNLAWWANADGYITWYNRRWYDYTGTTPEQMEGWGWQSVHDPEALPKVLERWMASIATGEPFEMEFPLRGSDGVFRTFLTRVMPLKDSTGRVVRWFGTNTDVSALKQAEEALKESEEKFRTIVETANEGIFVVDAERRTTYVNVKMAAMLGYTVQEMLGKSALYYLYAEGKSLSDLNIQKRQEGVSETYEIKFLRKDGSPVWTLVSAAPLFDNERRFMGTLSMITDITERKRAEEELLKLSEEMAARNVELEYANKEMESFIYSISHDLRAPIRTMSGFAKILHEDYTGKLDAQGQDYLNRILRGSDKSTQLIDALLHLSKISRQELDRIDVNLSKKASKIAEDLRYTDPSRNVEVVVQEGIIASADPRLIELVLSNLISNAWKFTSKAEKARIEFGSLEQDGEPVYFVRDNGAGFDMTYADKMFWPFHRLHTTQEFEGTGIGLTIVERVIRRHGGKVWAEGEVGKGATVFFTL